MTAELVPLERRGPLAVLTVANPPLNVLSDAVRHALYQRFEDLHRDDEVRVVILRGAGERAFSVGSNIHEFPLERGPLGGREKITLEQRMYQVLMNLPQVTIAAIQGHCLGGGLELALACDLRLAGADASLGFPEVKLGVFAAAGGTQRLLPLMGLARAKELMFLGDPLPAAAAAQLGLVNRVVPRDRLWAETEALAAQLLERPFRALRAIKAALHAAYATQLAAGQQTDADLFAQLFTSDDTHEGVSAFREKRQPRFRHR